MTFSACELWVSQSVSATFVRTNLADINLTRIDLTMRWLVNPPSRYIIGGYLDVLLRDNQPVTVPVTYQQPVSVASEDVIAIPFHGVVSLDLIPGGHSAPFGGTTDSSGGGTFTVG